MTVIMWSEGCVCKDPIELLPLIHLGEHSSGGYGSAELDFAHRKQVSDVSEDCVEKDALRGLRHKVPARTLISSHHTLMFIYISYVQKYSFGEPSPLEIYSGKRGK